MKQYANLHLHSTHSDGVYTPAELVRIAKDEGYRALALTDHDTTTGNADMRRECEAAGLDFIFGCEFSSPWRERRMNFHIVGFDFDPEYPEMKEYLAQRSFCEAEQTRILFERGLSEGLIHGIAWEEVLEYNKGVTWL
ncbi:MAG: PHP domain-containing protein, partial [Clostridia bacterium]|nr:PHP domain-containing protein [Clostridia bacterium]